MAVKTRPYLITREGKDRLVDAVSASAAIAHVTGDLITRCEAASGAMVAQFLTGGGTIEKAGVVSTSIKPAPVEHPPLDNREKEMLPAEQAVEWPAPAEEPADAGGEMPAPEEWDPKVAVEDSRGQPKDEWPDAQEMPEPNVLNSTEF